MLLYTCTDGKALASVGHPCGRAAKALDEAGHPYEMKQVKGGRIKFWTWPNRAQDRAEIERISSQRSVPIFVLDGGEVITGSGAIISWAKENQPAARAQ